MAMTEAQKKAVPKSKRGVPGKSGTGSYPMATKKQRGEAVALAAMHHGSHSAFTEKIRAKAARLGGGAAKRGAGKKMAMRHTEHAGRGGKREAKGHDAIGSHPGYTMGMKKRK